MTKPQMAHLRRAFANLVIVLVLGAYGAHFYLGRDDFPFSSFSIFTELRRGERHALRSYELVGIDRDRSEVRGLDAPLGHTVFRGWARRAHNDRRLRAALSESLFRFNELELSRRGQPVELLAIELRVTRFVIAGLDAQGVERGASRVMYRYAR